MLANQLGRLQRELEKKAEQAADLAAEAMADEPRTERQYGRVVVEPRTPRKSRAETVLLDTGAVQEELERRLRQAAKYIRPRERPVHVLPRKCAETYAACPWIKGYDYTLLAFPKKMHPKYVDAAIPAQEWEGMELFRASAAYLGLQCGPNRYRRVQKKDVLTLYDDAGAKVRLTLVHVLRTGEKVVQDERLFAEEKAWLVAQSRKGSLASLLAATVKTDPALDSIARSVIAAALEASLDALGPDGASREYAAKIAAHVYDFCDDWYSMRDLFFVASDILVFTDKLHFGRYAHSFTRKIARKMYRPDALLRLSYDEKLPEAFANIHMGTANATYIYDLIVQSRAEITAALGKQLHRLVDPTARVRGADLARPPLVNIPPAKSLCQVDGYEDWELVTYTHAGKTYCYPVSALLDRFLGKDYSNPDTGTDFDAPFVARVVNTYQPVAVVVPVVDGSHTRHAPKRRDAVDALLAAIAALEKQIATLDASQLENVCAYCNKHIARGGASTMARDGAVVKFCSMACLSK